MTKPTTNQPDASLNLVGNWNWATATGGWSGTFMITSQLPDGRIFGQFPESGRGDYSGTIQGKLTGTQVTFSRIGIEATGKHFEQVWTATVVHSGQSLRMDGGHWSMTIPTTHEGGFRAEKVPDK